MAVQSRRMEKTMAYGQYVHGNTVRQSQPDYVHVHSERPIRRENEKPHHMSFGYLLFLSGALIVAGLILTWYITMQSEITNSVKHISTLESQLNDMKQENDEAYNKANSSRDLEEIKKIAIQEYGMQYADQGQIVTYSDEGGNDYVRQNADIPDATGK
ncbi:MAG: cell division protein FtsL [Butyrivibrio sp.]|nr:cell division protein FtsL [Butyrivibrio sp.]